MKNILLLLIGISLLLIANMVDGLLFPTKLLFSILGGGIIGLACAKIKLED